VPVGEDQAQHLELSRDVARSFNARFDSDVFTIPEMVHAPVPRVMSLRDGSAKMSKSARSDLSRINLTDDVDAISKKIRRAVTDSIEGVSLTDVDDDSSERPEVRNLMRIYRSLLADAEADRAIVKGGFFSDGGGGVSGGDKSSGVASLSLAEVAARFDGRPITDFKAALTDVVVDRVAPVGERMRALLSSADGRAHLDAVLDDGATRAAAVANATLKRVYDATGLSR
jgi:tryptophanyl-tRNA synthetase